MTRSLAIGAAVVVIVGAVWTLARPLRERPRPAPDVSAARYRRLAPFVLGAALALALALVVSLVGAAIT